MLLSAMVALFLFLPLPTVVASPPKHNCGGRLTEAHGVIATPNFPRKFETPIHCQWQIDAQYVQLAVGWPVTIKIYLTQLYVLEGLTLTEYDSFDAYDYSPSTGGVLAFSLSEDDVTSNKTHIIVDKEYLIIDFHLERLESTQLRVLDGLLDVFGFNITYEISAEPPRPNRCTMKFCGFTGFCYDDFHDFKCDCFPGFSGPRCSEGPLSKCIHSDGRPVCENGGECRHVGHTALVCDCKPGFEGSFCERRKTQPPPTGCDENNPTCLISCSFNGTLEDVCRCDQGMSQKYLHAINESIGYSTRIFVQSRLAETDLRAALKRNILNMLKVNISKVEDINIFLYNTVNNETDVTVRFYAPKHQDELIRSTIRRWGRQQYGRIDNKNYALTERDILVKTDPYLFLEMVASDRTGAASEGDEVVLSCTARGSQNMRFRWFKDDILVNITSATTTKWESLISKGRNTDHYTALLDIGGANRFDHGRFTCQVEDYGIQQCRSMHVEIVQQPKIRLEPASLSVEKGEAFTIKCISLAKYGEKYKFSWTKDKYLLPIKTEFEHYEILYPGGSILQVARLNKTTTYSCLAHLDKLSIESSIVVYVVDKQVVRPCPADHYDAFAWPETAAGGEHKIACPKDYYGVTIRSCIMMENGQPRWLPPDYSNCTQDNLMDYLSDFRYLEEGYAKTTPLETLGKIKKYVGTAAFLHGEGRVILHFLQRIVAFNNASHDYSDQTAATDLILEIVDGVLAQNVSLNKEQQVVTLQKLVHSQLMILSARITQPYSKHLTNVQVSIKHDKFSINPAAVIQVNYRNLYAFLTKKSVIRLNYDDDREMIYELFSDVTSLWRWENPLHALQLQHAPKAKALFNLSDGVGAQVEGNGLDLVQDGNVKGTLHCFLAEYAASDYVWDASQCRLVKVHANTSKIVCECDSHGTMALLLVEEIKTRSAELHHTVRDDVVVGGCAACFAMTTLAGILLSISWCRHKSTMTFLKGQCALSIASCMLLFIVGFLDVIAQRFYLNVLSCLLISYLSALSSQLSTLLIIYAELIDMQKIANIKQTVVGIISGAPVIAVFTNHLTHNIKGIPLMHWWIVRNTLSFYIFIVCLAVVLVLYVIVCCLVSKMLKFEKTKSDKVLQNRSLIVTKSTLIFMMVAISAGTSVVCVNFPGEVMWRYTFAGTSIFMGATTLICLVFKVRAFSFTHILERIHRNKEQHTTHKHNPAAKGSKDAHHVSQNKCASKRGGIVIDTLVDNTLQSPEIEEYNASPTQYATAQICSKSNSLNSPDILGTKVFAELDLLASSRQTEVDIDEECRTQVGPQQHSNSPQQTRKSANVGGCAAAASRWTHSSSQLNNIAEVNSDVSSVKSNLPSGNHKPATVTKFSKTDKCVTFAETVEYNVNVIDSPVDNDDCSGDGGSSITITPATSAPPVQEEVEEGGKEAVKNADASGANEAAGAHNLNDVMDGICNDLKYLLNGHQFADPIGSISC